MMERWNIGILGLKSIPLKNIMILGDTVKINPANLNPNTEALSF